MEQQKSVPQLSEEELRKMREAAEAAKAAVNTNSQLPPIQPNIDTTQQINDNVNAVQVSAIPNEPSPKDKEVEAINQNPTPPAATDVKTGIDPLAVSETTDSASTEEIKLPSENVSETPISGSALEETSETVQPEPTQIESESVDEMPITDSTLEENVTPENDMPTETPAEEPLQDELEVGPGIQIDQRVESGQEANSPDQQSETSESPAPQPQAVDNAPINEQDLNSTIQNVEAVMKENGAIPPIMEDELLSKETINDSQPASETPSIENQSISPEAQSVAPVDAEQTQAAKALENALNAPVESTMPNTGPITSEPMSNLGEPMQNSMPESQMMNMNSTGQSGMNASENNPLEMNNSLPPIQSSAETMMNNNSNAIMPKIDNSPLPSQIDQQKHSPSELPSLESAPHKTTGAPTSSSSANPTLGKTEGTGSAPNKLGQEKPNENKMSEGGGITSILSLIGIAIVLATLVLFLFFTFVITPDEGSIFYAIRQSVNSLF